MMRRKGRAAQGGAQERLPTAVRKSEILEEASKLFHKKGFHGTSVEDLAAASGVSKATLYYHTKNKEQILYDIHERFMQEGFRLLSEIEAATASSTEKLTQFFVAQCRLTDKHQSDIAVVMAELDRLSPRRRRAMIDKREKYLAVLVRILSEGIDRGEFRPIDPGLTALCVMGMVNWLHKWYRPSGPLGPDEIGRHMAAIVIGGLSAPDVGSGTIPGWQLLVATD
jgi:TetR/AcrR family transcriptional regulator, cholesterol catabolism regulator